MDINEIVRAKLSERHLKTTDLEQNSINLKMFAKYPSWEMAVRLSNVLGETPSYWMDLVYHSLKQRKR